MLASSLTGMPEESDVSDELVISFKFSNESVLSVAGFDACHF
jgi:hypothetical protein